MRGASLLGLGLAACTADTLEVELDLAVDGCAAEDFARVSVVSIEVYGEHEGTRCALGRRCLFAVDVPAPLADIDDLAAVLAAANQPLVEGELAGAEYIHVVGREQSCWDLPPAESGSGGGVAPDHPMCGANDFAAVEDGSVPIVMRCDACTPQEVDLCP